MKIILLSVVAFIVGSIPTGLIIAKHYAIDLQKIGSGNIGATNVLRTIGKIPALLTLCGDLLKGVVAVLIARHFEVGIFHEGFIGIFSIIGHNFSIFLKFRGGKGVATSLGMLSIYAPKTAFFTIILWVLSVIITKYSSVGALISFGMLPLSIFFIDGKEKLPIAFLITTMMFIRHRDNITRILNGTELKAGKKI